MKTKSGPLFVGGVFEDPQTRRLVYVESGAYEVDHRISNHWTFREIEKDGTLGRSYSSYGWFAIPIPAKIEVRVHLRSKVPRRSIGAVVMNYGAFEASFEDAEKTPVAPGKPKLSSLEPNQTTLSPDRKIVLRCVARFGDMIRYVAEPKRTRTNKVTCSNCYSRILRKLAHCVSRTDSNQQCARVWLCGACK